MNPERWRRAREIFDELADLPRGKWPVRLAELCDGDDELRAEVRALLEADAQTTGGESILADRAPAMLADFALKDEAEARERLAGTRLGPFRLEREIGRGGMGAVWLAERADGEYAQAVAIKLIRHGWDSAEALARFRAERQILAQLDHPNIAHLIDGGVGPGGKPWLALEYVDGVDLVAWCDRERLDVDHRLALFLTVCDVVAHAHARLVVHRDLKPSNILVRGDGEVKLLDFGIAKLLDADVANVSVTRSFTPEFAAPEQLRGEFATTAVDIYALGLLLYQLLTGRRPYRLENSTPAAYERAILDQEPTRPSVAATRDDPDVDADVLAAQRDLTPERLRRELRGDLDAIVLKALRKEPAQRYANVAEFAADIRRHRERRPVVARRGGWRYRAGRFVSRHFVAVAAAVVTMLALAIGLGVAVWQAQAARREAAKSAEVVAFMLDLFRGSNPDAAHRSDVSARELLAEGVDRIQLRLVAQPEVRAELLHTMATAYTGIGLPREALALARQTVDLRRQIGEPRQVARALINLGGLLGNTGDRTGAVAVFDEADPLIAGNDRQARLLRAQSEYRRGVVLLNDADNAPQVEKLLRSAVQTQTELAGPTAAETLTARLMLARVLAQRERFDEALAITDAIAADLRAQQPLPADDLGETLNARGRIYWRMKRYVDYERDSRETVELARSAFGDASWSVAIARHNHATSLFYLQRFDEAIEQSQQAIDSARKLLPAEHPFLIAALQRHGDNAAALQRWDDAAHSYEAALAQQSSEHAAKGGRQREGVEALQGRLDAVRAGRLPDAVAKNLQR